MKVLVACECSGVVRDAFIAGGHDAISCDLKPTERPGPHYQGDVKDLLNNNKYDMMIAHPPCTYLARVGAPHFVDNDNRMEKCQEAAEFFLWLWQQDVQYICIENPYPSRHAKLDRWSQVIHPYFFGDEWLKATCLWLKNLPPLAPTKPMPNAKIRTTWERRPSGTGRLMDNQKSWVMIKEHKFDPVARARTFDGIAAAMADQWSNLKRPYGFFT